MQSSLKLSFKQLKNLLKDPNNKNLLEFLEQLFKLFKVDRKENAVTEDQENLDALARLLVGDECCSAVAFSGAGILLATNYHLHHNDHLSVTRYVTVLERNLYQYRVGFTDEMFIYKDGKFFRKITKDSASVTFQFVAASNTFAIIDGDPNIEFSQAEHGIRFHATLDMPISLKGTFKKDANIIRRGFDSFVLNKKSEFLRFPVLEINPLRRRAQKLVHILGVIVHSILNKPDLEDIVEKTIVETNKQWPMFLHDSLSYELSMCKAYKNDLCPLRSQDQEDKTVHQGVGPMLKLYEWLVEDYQGFKRRETQKTSLDSIQKWWKSIEENIHNIDAVPGFIKAKPEEFLKKGLRYFTDLVRALEFIRQDAKREGRLSSILLQENFFEKTVSFTVIDGIERQHAEMRLLEQHLTDNTDLSNYFGITKLCCASCAFVLSRFQSIGCRGSHGALFGGWVLGNKLKEPTWLKTLLGQELYANYSSWKETAIQLPHDSKKTISKACVALQLIEELASFNAKEILEEIGLKTELLIEFTKDDTEMYPSEVRGNLRVCSGFTPLAETLKQKRQTEDGQSSSFLEPSGGESTSDANINTVIGHLITPERRRYCGFRKGFLNLEAYKK